MIPALCQGISGSRKRMINSRKQKLILADECSIIAKSKNCDYRFKNCGHFLRLYGKNRLFYNYIALQINIR